MNVLVTGGAGFIGSHLADRLIEDGHRVLVVDNESTGRIENVPPAAKYIRADVSNQEELEPAFAAGVDAVCHIAGHVSLIGSFADPIKDLRINLQGTVNVLQLCLRHRVPRLLYASSMTAYGRNGVLPTPENTPCEPISYYGITKYAGERYVHTTAERPDLDFDFRVTSFRMYNVYGPRQALDNPYQGVLGIFIGNVIRGEPITIFGDGEQTRDFTFVDDAVKATICAATRGVPGRVYNIGGGSRVTLNHVLEIIGRVSGRQPIISVEPDQKGDMRHTFADTERARTDLAFAPSMDLAHGLAAEHAWLKRTLDLL